MKPTLLILAAGMGSRYGGLKQIDEMGPAGEAIIDYSMYDAVRAGFGKIVFVIRKEFDAAFREKFGHIADHIDVEYVYQDINPVIEGVSYPERTKPWGTGHAVLSAADTIDTPFVVISADDYYGPHAFGLAKEGVEEYVDNQTSITFCYRLGNTLSEHGSVNRGVCQLDDGYLVDSTETLKIERDGDQARYPDGDDRHSLSLDTPVGMLMYGVDLSIFDVLREKFATFVADNTDDPKAEFHFPNVLGEGIADGSHRSKVLVNDDQWSGVSYRDDKVNVQTRLAGLTEDAVYPTPLWG